MPFALGRTPLFCLKSIAMHSILFTLLLGATLPVAAASIATVRHTAAPRAFVGTTAKVRRVYSDSTSVVVTTIYRYGQDSLGNRVFLDSAGRPYAGNDTFVYRLAEALRRIEDGGATGRALVSYLEADTRMTQIVAGPRNEADMDLGEYVHWDPDGTISAPDQTGNTRRPAFVGLAHELAHICDVWRGTVNRRIWRVLPGDEENQIEVPYAELYATHIENKVRAENGLPLRVSYAGALIDGEGVRRYADAASLLLRPGTRESLYFTSDGRTAYRTLRRSERPEVY